MDRQFRGLREHGFPPFSAIVSDPEAELVPLEAAAPATSENVEWDGDTARGAGPDSSLTYLLPWPRYVLAARVRYTLEKDLVWFPTSGRAVWQEGGDGEEYTAPLRLVPQQPHLPAGGGHSAWVWINARIDRLRLHPDDAPFSFRLEELVLLTPLKKGRK